jgi:hypothetical protein
MKQTRIQPMQPCAGRRSDLGLRSWICPGRTGLAWLFGLSLVAGCGDLDPEVGAVREGAAAGGICAEGDSDPTTEVTFSDVREMVFERKCGCHVIAGGLGQTVGGLDLSDFDAIQIGGVRSQGRAIVAGDACASVIVQKTGNDTVPFGARMPLSGDTLDAASRQLIIDWIAEGAKP